VPHPREHGRDGAHPGTTDADEGTEVTVEIAGESDTALVNASGEWSITWPYSLTYTAHQVTARIDLLGEICAFDTQTINVVNSVPAATPDAYSVNEDDLLTVTAPGMLANDLDLDSDPLTAIKVTDPANGTLVLNDDGSFTYTPNAHFNGTDSFQYTAFDGVTQTDETTVTITVNPVNDSPIAVDDAYTTAEETPLTVPAPGVLSNDTDADTGAVLEAALVAGPDHGTLTLNADGSFTYTPDADFVGTDTFRYASGDGTDHPARGRAEGRADPDADGRRL